MSPGEEALGEPERCRVVPRRPQPTHRLVRERPVPLSPVCSHSCPWGHGTQAQRGFVTGLGPHSERETPGPVLFCPSQPELLAPSLFP